MTEKHKQLQRTAIGWLYSRGCDIFADEVETTEGRADAIGLCRRGDRDIIYLIEAKVSRGDFLSRKQKVVYSQSIESPASDFYYFILADGVVVADSDYPAWGIIDERGKVIRRAKKMNADHSRQAGWRNKDIARLIAHTLVYRVYGKLYGNVATDPSPSMQ